MCLHVGHRETGSPRKSFREFRSKLPSLGHSLSKRLIKDLSKGLMVTENKAFSTASICMPNHFYKLCIQTLVLIIFLSGDLTHVYVSLFDMYQPLKEPIY